MEVSLLYKCLLLSAFCACLCMGYTNVYVNTTLTLQNHNVTWITAASACNDSDSSFYDLSINDPNLIAEVKRKTQFRMDTRRSGWVGNHITYDIDLNQDSSVNSMTDFCLAMRFKSEIVVGAKYQYDYDIIAMNCTTELFSACNDTNTIFFSTTTTPRLQSCDQGGVLWIPPMTVYPVADEMSIASGNFSGDKHNGNLLGHTYWTGGRISTRTSHLPVVGNILQCGFLAINESNISYQNCYHLMQYICESAASQEHEEPTQESVTSSKVGIYTGALLGIITLISACVFVVVGFIRRRKQRIRDTNGDDNNLPKGGKSFTRRPKKENAIEDPRSNRETTYNKIDIGHAENKAPEKDRRFENGNKSTHGIDDSADFVYAMYQKVQKKPNDTKSNGHQPKSLSHPGYLTMDGKQKVDSEYDTLKNVGSVNSGYNARGSITDADENVYGMTMTDEQESFYDSTVIVRNLSQKALINSDYDHVTLKNDPEMNRSVCNSTKDMSGSSKRPVPLPRSNPSYDTTTNIVK